MTSVWFGFKVTTEQTTEEQLTINLKLTSNFTQALMKVRKRLTGSDKTKQAKQVKIYEFTY